MSLTRYGQRVLAARYNLNGVTHDWPLELPAGKVFADDSKLRHTFESPSESKDSPDKSCRFIVKNPKVIDDPSYKLQRRQACPPGMEQLHPFFSLIGVSMPWRK